MKCDELKSFIVRYNGEFIRAYKETYVDNAIAELKEFAEDACLERDDNQTAIDELNDELESLKATHYTESVDAGMENRMLNRKLWLARANRVLEKIAWFKLLNASISTMNPEDGARQEYEKWKKNLGKFLKKADEYK